MNSIDKMFALTKGMMEVQAKIDRAIGTNRNIINPQISDLAVQAIEHNKLISKLGISNFSAPLAAAQVLSQVSSPKYNQSILGISAAQVLSQISQKHSHEILKSSAALAAISILENRDLKPNINDFVGSSVARALYEGQQNIFRKLEGQFKEVNRLTSSSSLTADSLESYRKEKSDLFDAISISKLTDIITRVEANGDTLDSVEESMIQINELVNDEVIQSKLAQLMDSITKVFSRKRRKATHHDFENILATRQYIILFIHNNILGRVGFSFQATNVLIDMIDSWVVKLIVVSSILEPLVQNITAPYIGLEDKPTKQKTTKNIVYKHYKKNYYFDIGSKIDIATVDAKVYLRNSIKTKCLGTLMKGTTVEVLSEKPNWSFIRANIKCFDKKSKLTSTCLLQAWVKKGDLENAKNKN